MRAWSSRLNQKSITICKTTSRFDNWLQEAADTTETVPEETPEIVDAELNEEQKAQAEAIIARNRAAQAERNNNEENEENDQVGELPEIERDAFRTLSITLRK